MCLQTAHLCTIYLARSNSVPANANSTASLFQKELDSKTLEADSIKRTVQQFASLENIRVQVTSLGEQITIAVAKGQAKKKIAQLHVDRDELTSSHVNLTQYVSAKNALVDTLPRIALLTDWLPFVSPDYAYGSNLQVVEPSIGIGPSILQPIDLEENAHDLSELGELHAPDVVDTPDTASTAMHMSPVAIVSDSDGMEEVASATSARYCVRSGHSRQHLQRNPGRVSDTGVVPLPVASSARAKHVRPHRKGRKPTPDPAKHRDHVDDPDVDGEEEEDEDREEEADEDREDEEDVSEEEDVSRENGRHSAADAVLRAFQLCTVNLAELVHKANADKGVLSVHQVQAVLSLLTAASSTRLVVQATASRVEAIKSQSLVFRPPGDRQCSWCYGPIAGDDAIVECTRCCGIILCKKCFKGLQLDVTLDNVPATSRWLCMECSAFTQFQPRVIKGDCPVLARTMSDDDLVTGFTRFQVLFDAYAQDESPRKQDVLLLSPFITTLRSYKSEAWLDYSRTHSTELFRLMDACGIALLSQSDYSFIPPNDTLCDDVEPNVLPFSSRDVKAIRVLDHLASLGVHPDAIPVVKADAADDAEIDIGRGNTLKCVNRVPAHTVLAVYVGVMDTLEYMLADSGDTAKYNLSLGCPTHGGPSHAYGIRTHVYPDNRIMGCPAFMANSCSEAYQRRAKCKLIIGTTPAVDTHEEKHPYRRRAFLVSTSSYQPGEEITWWYGKYANTASFVSDDQNRDKKKRKLNK